MSAPIPLRDYVVGGLVSVEVVNALLALSRSYRAWIRLRNTALPGRYVGRTFGRPELSPQFAAENLLAKLEGVL